MFASAEMIVKVEEPRPTECAMLRPDPVLFTYLHLAADLALAFTPAETFFAQAA